MAKLHTMFGTKDHEVVSQREWLEARIALLEREKVLTRLRDEINAARRALPWTKVTSSYLFDGPSGKVTLADLFDSSRQLLVYHFMLGPGWEEGCPSCSFWADNFNGITAHLRARDTNLIAVSQAPFAEIERFKQRMGWKFPWVSSFNTTFNYDYKVTATAEEVESGRFYYNYRVTDLIGEQMPGVSAFYKDEDDTVYHTYSTYERGIDSLNCAYGYLDLTAKGRDEDWSKAYAMDWVRHHDRYQEVNAKKRSSCCGK